LEVQIEAEAKMAETTKSELVNLKSELVNFPLNIEAGDYCPRVKVIKGRHLLELKEE
jgi:hypothetical protein